MAQRIENMCVGCAECIRCSRKYQTRIVFYCDSCGGEIEDKVYTNGSADFCFDCAIETLFKKYAQSSFSDVRRDMEAHDLDPDDIYDVIEYFKIPAEDLPFDYFYVTDDNFD